MAQNIKKMPPPSRKITYPSRKIPPQIRQTPLLNTQIPHPAVQAPPPARQMLKPAKKMALPGPVGSIFPTKHLTFSPPLRIFHPVHPTWPSKTRPPRPTKTAPPPTAAGRGLRKLAAAVVLAARCGTRAPSRCPQPGARRPQPAASRTAAASFRTPQWNSGSELPHSTVAPATHPHPLCSLCHLWFLPRAPSGSPQPPPGQPTGTQTGSFHPDSGVAGGASG